jgi:FtsZ-binding cell division protein ZapB
MVQGTQEMGTIKEGVQDAGERLSELRLLMEEQQAMIENQFLLREKEKQSKTTQIFWKQRLTSLLGKLKDKVLSWLSVADPRSNHDRACKSHKSGTGEWFTKGQAYRNWLTKPKSFCWLNGKAGCGKTVLSSSNNWLLKSTLPPNV